MKKLIASLLLATPLAALPVGNPAEPSLMTSGLLWDECNPCPCEILSLRTGFYGDYVFNRHLRDAFQEFEHASIYTNAGYLAANLWNRIDFFATLGASSLFVETNEEVFVEPETGGRVQFESNSRFSWSVGGRASLLEYACYTLGAEAQYFSTNVNLSRATFSGSTGTTSFYPDTNVHYKEWQAGLGISRRIYMFVPYVAVKWSKCMLFSRVSLDDLGSEVARLRNRKSWGYAVGCTLVDSCSASLTAEARFADEKALYVNGQFRF